MCWPPRCLERVNGAEWDKSAEPQHYDSCLVRVAPAQSTTSKQIEKQYNYDVQLSTIASLFFPQQPQLILIFVQRRHVVH